jgi:ABC-type uncharacterized transport system auxiliary subunit
MKTTIIIALCALLGGCATAETIQVLDNIITYVNHAPSN